jgi:tRNA/rRNA methyltransferase
VYEISRGRATAKVKNKLSSAAADMESVNRIATVLLEALHASGYIHWRATATAEEKLRRMLRRFALSSSDAEVLLGMLRKILWKLKSE